jgi:hypothetical protein
MRVVMTAVAMIAVSAMVAGAADTVVQKRIPTIHLEKCAITLLDADGIKPLAGAALALNQAEDGKTVVSAVANKAGLCEITVAEGRYVLTVNERPITLINAAKDGQLAWARIVVSETPMLVGGQEGATEEEESKKLFAFFGLSGAPAVGAAVLVGAAAVGGGYAVYDNNKDDGDDTPPTPEPTTPTVIRTRPAPVSP